MTGDVNVQRYVFFHVVARSNWTVQWFIQANQKTSPSPLLVNTDVTPSTDQFAVSIPTNYNIPQLCLTLEKKHPWLLLSALGA